MAAAGWRLSLSQIVSAMHAIGGIWIPKVVEALRDFISICFCVCYLSTFSRMIPLREDLGPGPNLLCGSASLLNQQSMSKCLENLRVFGNFEMHAI